MTTTTSFNRQQNNFTDDQSIHNEKIRTNLIINYLPQTMTQDEMKDLFGSMGAIESCKLVRDKTTGQSLGYGFVNFIRSEDAEKAVQSMNGLRIQNKTIKVSFARPSSESIKFANLYICGIPKQWTIKDLENYFQSCGKIITSRILIDPNTGGSKSVGFIRFDQRCEAEIAISKLNGTIPKGFVEPVNVKFANAPQPVKSSIGFALSNPLISTSILNCQQSLLHGVSSSIRQNLSRFSSVSNKDFFGGNEIRRFEDLSPLGWSIFVYNLPTETEENVLWQLFGPFGAVQNVKIIRDLQTQKCKGFAFVTMTNYDEALMAINSLNGFTLANRILQVSFKTNKPIALRPF